MAMHALPDELYGVQEPRICSIPPRHSDQTGIECVEFCESVGFEWDPWQAQTLKDSLGTRKNGTWAAKEVAEVLSRQNGKNATDCNIPIATRNRGWLTAGTLRPGDEVYGSAGTPTRILAVSEVFRDEPCYEVSFTDGSCY